MSWLLLTIAFLLGAAFMFALIVVAVILDERGRKEERYQEGHRPKQTHKSPDRPPKRSGAVSRQNFRDN